MIFLLAALLCLTSGLEEDALARSNKLLRKQNEALVKALHTITEERAVGNAQCAHINEDNADTACNRYYKNIAKCDICQDDNAGAVDNSAINDAIQVTYSVTSGGKCITLNGEDPKYQYEHGKGSECEELCTARNDCFGYSISGYDNCLLWLQRDIMGGGDDWAGADCHIKDERAVGNDQCAHINDGNKKYACNRYYKYIAKCDICQDDDSGAVDNSAINDAIPKRERAVGDAQCAHINDGNKKYACNRYYKYIAKCDICQDDDSGAVDNSAINDAIPKTKEKQVGERGAGHDWRERTHQGSGTTFTGSFGRPRGQEKAVGAEPCDSYCESWSKFKESKIDDNSQEEICGMYKSTRCSTCADVQAYCGWKKVTEDEVYTYSVAPGGKCRTLDGEDPKYLYEGGKGSTCEQLCDGMNDCFGYSISGFDNCLLWLQRDIMGGGDEWGGADCHIKDISCSGNVGEDYNCNECYDGFSKKYLWGSACQAKNWGADTYTKGVCGKEYKCFTKGEDIGDCPYDEYCPSV